MDVKKEGEVTRKEGLTWHFRTNSYLSWALERRQPAGTTGPRL